LSYARRQGGEPFVLIHDNERAAHAADAPYLIPEGIQNLNP
jgi:hypothetical protein